MRDSLSGDIIYWRLHGRGGYSYVYSAEELDWMVAQARHFAAEGRTVYTLFNNLAMSKDALRFAERAGTCSAKSFTPE